MGGIRRTERLFGCGTCLTSSGGHGTRSVYLCPDIDISVFLSSHGVLCLVLRVLSVLLSFWLPVLSSCPPLVCPV